MKRFATSLLALVCLAAGGARWLDLVNCTDLATGFSTYGSYWVRYAVVGAVISEWLGGFEGLGVYMTRVKKAYAFDKMFAVIVFISVISLLLMALVALAQRLAMPWANKGTTKGKE